ncbi:BACON domain-containing protein [Anaeromyxobacter terrae]|uniref:BACON domain-containing protein n=1 Tax=Anaeromyxobacter terrae TaxID=2925406 RepID=UPI001F56759C|nr:hypothetical protein [Anaeromyxobacter sp. SG22]
MNHPDAYYVAAGYPQGTTEPTWLSKSLYGSGNSWTLSTSVTTTALAAGTYSATLRVGVARQDQTIIEMKDVQVTYTVQPGISAWPSTEQFAYVLGSSTMPSTQTIVVSGTTGVSWTASPSESWVSLTAESGTVPSNTRMSVNPAGLGPGTHTATVTFTGGGVTSIVGVTLTITAPALTATPAGTIALGGASGHDLSGKDVQLSLSTGTRAFGWTATGAPTWLRLSSSSGSVSGTAVPVTLSPDLAGLAAGTYTGAVTFTANVDGSDVSTSVPVSLTLDAHKLFASDGGVAFSSVPGLSRLTRALRIRSNRGLTTTWNATTDAPTWLTVTSSGTTDDALVLTANPAGLAADTLHRAVVSITSQDPTVVGTETVQVALWIGSSTPAASTSLAAIYAEIAADPMRPYAYVHNRGTDVVVYNVYTGTQVATIARIGTKLGQMTVSSDGAQLFVIDDTSKTIVPVDLGTRTVGAPWALEIPTYTSEPNSFVAYARVQGVGVVFANDHHVYDAATGSRYATTAFSGSVLAASRDGSRLCGITRSSSPYTLKCYAVDVSGLTGEILLGAAKSPSDAGSNGRDVAIDEDGSRVYVASGAPYAFAEFDATASGATMPMVKYLSGSAYPVAVEVGSEGRIYCGADNPSGTNDVWIYDAAGSLQSAYTVTHLTDRGIAVSGDGLRMLTLTSTALKLFTVGP